jgi:hypothetical protein
MKVAWTSQLTDIAKNQIPFAAAQTNNELAKLAADDIRGYAKRKLRVRSPTLLKFFVRGPDKRGTKADPRARVAVSAPKGAKDPQRGNLLIQHDVDGTNVKKPFKGNSMMVPTRQYKQESGGKPRLWSVFKRDMGIGTKRGLGRGNNLGTGRRFATYLIKSRRGKTAGQTLLFLRTGVGRGRSELLYAEQPLVRNPRRLRTKALTELRVRKSSALIMKRELSKAIASAKAVTRGGGVASTRLA